MLLSRPTKVAIGKALSGKASTGFFFDALPRDLFDRARAEALEACDAEILPRFRGSPAFAALAPALGAARRLCVTPQVVRRVLLDAACRGAFRKFVKWAWDKRGEVAESGRRTAEHSCVR